jgi:cell division protein FtsW
MSYRKTDIWNVIDWWTVAIYLILVSAGWLCIYTSSYNFDNTNIFDLSERSGMQAIWILTSISLAFILLMLDRNIYSVLAYFIYAFVIFLLIVTIVFAPEIKGSLSWLVIGPLRIQPAEFAKFAVVLFLANYFSKPQSIAAKKTESIPVLGLMAFVLVIFLQKDFSTATFILVLGALLFFVSGTSIGTLISFAVLAIPVTVLFIFTEPYRINRLIAFANPDFDIHGINFQTRASRLAISAGGLFGEGIGAGLSRINRIPEVQADYIFAGWTEAMGFAGVLMYLALIAFFAWRGFSIALHCENNFASLCAFGCVLCVVLQSLFNCGVVSNALPPTGLPLPFFSSGGSNLLATFCMCGMLLQVSRIKPMESGQDYA